jgi:hypothetical protein
MALKDEPVCNSPHLLIIVLTFDRWASLQRLLESLRGVDYGCAPVDITINIDASDSLEVLPAVEETYKVASNFDWNYGTKSILRRVQRVGLRKQWLESFYSRRGIEYVAVFEDDLELSSQFYTYLSMLHTTERSVLHASNVSALCLYPLGARNQVNCTDSETSNVLFLSSHVCSWGPIWKATEWQKLLDFTAQLEAQGKEPFLIEGAPDYAMFNGWMHAGKDLQSPWVARFMYENGYNTLAYDATKVRLTLASLSMMLHTFFFPMLPTFICPFFFHLLTDFLRVLLVSTV